MNRKLIIPFVIISSSLLLVACSLPTTAQKPAPTSAQPQSAVDLPATQVVQTASAMQTLGAYNTVVAELTQISQFTPTPLSPTNTPITPSVVSSPTATETPTSTATLTPTAVVPSATPVLITNTPASTYCDWAMYIDDMTVADGSTFSAGQPFTKTWRLKNNGTCTWTTDYALVFAGGNAMGGSTAINLRTPVLPGQLVDLSVNLVAPQIPGAYTGYWMLRNASGATFGINEYANGPFWVKINVAGFVPTTQYTNAPFPLTSIYCQAQWQSSVSNLNCPSQINDFANGSVILSMSSKLQDGTFNTSPALIVIPNNGAGGMISGTFPSYTVRVGDRFSTAVGCLANSPNCNITFQVNFTANGGNQQSLGSWIETANGTITPINIDLSPYVNQTLTFILVVKNNNGSSTDDRGFWLMPQIYNP